MKKRYNYLLPILFSIVLATGMLIGAKFRSTPIYGDQVQLIDPEDKFEKVIKYIRSSYVDEVDEQQLVENAIEGMLENLDPHSVYIPAKELQAMNEPLEGNFEGIGVEFNILNDTIMVVSPISGGPSEELGIRAGDKIIEIEGENVAGIDIANEDVIGKLRGKKGTLVNVTIKRQGVKRPLEFTIKRDKIPLYSIDASYLINKNVGYIKVNRFSATTIDEFDRALIELKGKGMENLILDLRGNPGGYLNAAIKMADEFLKDDKMIVYTEGVKRPRQVYNSTTRGKLEKGKLIVLIDEGSASASEIVSGAIQDHDRGLIIGRRSFGKGLVQEPYLLPDGSGLRLTVARYYTPSGRSIQKPYDDGVEAYHEEILKRFEHGEFVNADSIQFADSLKYKTGNGRVVYGGGGIMPDIFVPIDTSDNSTYSGKLIRKGLISRFALDYTDKNRERIEKNYASLEEFIEKFDAEARMAGEFREFTQKNGVKFSPQGYARSRGTIYNQLKALIARQFWGNEAFYRISNQNQKSYTEAIKAMEGAKFNVQGFN